MRLNLGCGNDYREGFVNVDSGMCRCDVSHDLFMFPWPLPDNEAGVVVIKHLMEHVPKDKFISFMRELYRVSEPSATIIIESPYALSDNFMTDPTHTMPITVRTFDFFDETKPLHENGKIYGWTGIKFKVDSATLVNNPPNGPDVHHLLRVIK